MAYFHPFNGWVASPHICAPLFLVHSCVDGYYSCLQAVAIVSRTAVNSVVPVPLSNRLLWWASIYEPSRGIAGSEAISVFRIGRTLYAFSTVAVTYLLQRHRRVPFFPSPLLHSLFEAVLIIAIMWAFRWYLFAALICNFWMMSSGEDHLMWWSVFFFFFSCMGCVKLPLRLASGKPVLFQIVIGWPTSGQFLRAGVLRPHRRWELEVPRGRGLPVAVTRNGRTVAALGHPMCAQGAPGPPWKSSSPRYPSPSPAPFPSSPKPWNIVRFRVLSSCSGTSL